jgi:hypothetical protein
VVETRWDLIVQAIMRALVVEYVAKVIEAALLCAKRCRRRFRRVLLQRAMHPLVATVCCGQRRAFERDDREWQSIGGVPVRGRRTLALLFFIHASRVLRRYDHDNTKTAIDFLQQVREHFPFAIQKIQSDNGSSFGPQVTWHFSDLHISHKHNLRAAGS